MCALWTEPQCVTGLKFIEKTGLDNPQQSQGLWLRIYIHILLCWFPDFYILSSINSNEMIDLWNNHELNPVSVLQNSVISTPECLCLLTDLFQSTFHERQCLFLVARQISFFWNTCKRRIIQWCKICGTDKTHGFLFCTNSLLGSNFILMDMRNQPMRGLSSMSIAKYSWWFHWYKPFIYERL